MRLTARAALAVVFMALFAAPAAAQGRDYLGWSLSVSNDSIGEFRDRWQSSSVQFGALWGPEWDGRAPGGFGELFELRLRSDILHPESLAVVVPTDRPHAGVLAIGLHSYQSFGATDLRLGGDIVVVGPQTGLYRLQSELHELLGFTVPDIEDHQIGNATQLEISGELAREWSLGHTRVRPFVEAQSGAEDFLRAGVDISLAGFGVGDHLMRATATGQRLPYGLANAAPGFSYSLGADIARVYDSIYLPADEGFELTPFRKRVRAGLQYKGEKLDAFYGLTWLGREFQAQPEGQLVGTFQIKYDF